MGMKTIKAAGSKSTSSGVPSDPREVRVGKQSPPTMKEIGGSGYELWDQSLLHRTYMTAPRLAFKGDDAEIIESRNAGLAGLGVRAFAPTDAVEAMIAGQAVMLHFMAMECARRAMVPEQHPDVASKLRKEACNASRAMIEMTEALQRRRGKGTQVVRVERVTVEAGGQAVVGTIQTGTNLPTSGGTPPMIDQGGGPNALDVVPRQGDERGWGYENNPTDDPLHRLAFARPSTQKQSLGGVMDLKPASCGAKTRNGSPCRNLPMRNGRCRMHGGKSTGPRTPEGKARQRAAVTVHGGRTREMQQLRARIRELKASTKRLIEIV